MSAKESPLPDESLQETHEAASPSGATDRPAERAKKFDEEGGDQPQRSSQAAVNRELRQVQSQHGSSQHQRQHSSVKPGVDGSTDAETNQQTPSGSVEASPAEDDIPVDRESFRYQKNF